jgi:hypothetical protein
LDLPNSGSDEENTKKEQKLALLKEITEENKNEEFLQMDEKKGPEEFADSKTNTKRNLL